MEDWSGSAISEVISLKNNSYTKRRSIMLNILFLITVFVADPGGSSGQIENNKSTLNVGSTSTHVDEKLSTTENLTILAGETAILACKIYNLGNKSVRMLFA